MPNTPIAVAFMKPVNEAPDKANVLAVFLNVMYSNDQTLRMSYALEGQHAGCGDVYRMFDPEVSEWEPVPIEHDLVVQCRLELQNLGYDVELVNPDDTDAVEFHLLNAK